MYKVGEEKQLCYSNSGGQRSSETRACYRAGRGERSTVGTSRQERGVGWRKETTAALGDPTGSTGFSRERTTASPNPPAAAVVFNCKPLSTPCREAALSILTLGGALGLRGVLRERSFSFA